MFYAISLCYPENRFLRILDIECAEMQTCFPMQNNLDMKCELGTPSNIAASICQKVTTKLQHLNRSFNLGTIICNLSSWNLFQDLLLPEGPISATVKARQKVVKSW